jgi:translation initiation factor 2B subunit (eIF-2B alpha/beta/delta family)
MNEALHREIAAIGADSRSGATAILSRAVAVLRAAASDRQTLEAAAHALCRAQPSMAGLRVAASVALRAADPAPALDAFAARTARAPRVIARLTVGLLKLRRTGGPLCIVTCSRSTAVEQALVALARERDVEIEVCCAESRPALEGRALAESLAGAGIHVRVYTDAGVGAAMRGAEAFLAGADAVGPDAFINKVGTGALAALASVEGVPTYVLAGREKFVGADVFARLTQPGGASEEVWSGAPAAVDVSNPYFELIRNVSVAAFVTDAGVLSTAEVGDIAEI